MKNPLPLLGLLVVLVMSSCSSPYSYLGKSYQATINPEMFFREQDVSREYEIMGKLQAEMPSTMNMEKVQRKLISEAAQKGADAILIENFDLVTGGFQSTGIGGGKSNKNGGSIGVSTSGTEVKKDVKIEATLIKYKN